MDSVTVGFINFYLAFFLTVDSSWIDFAVRYAAETACGEFIVLQRQSAVCVCVVLQRKVCGVCIVLQRQPAVCVLCCRDRLRCVYCAAETD